MGAQVGFDYKMWVTRYPEFAGVVSADLAALYFQEATDVQPNDGRGPVTDAGTQLRMLNMLVAHIAKLNLKAVDGSQANPLVGRINSASEGSVSVQTDYKAPTGDLESWALQTTYGAQWWAMTASYRTMNYRTRPSRNMNPWFNGGRRF